MNRIGFEKLFAASQVSIMGVIASVWRKTKIVHDGHVENCLDCYIKASKSVLNHPRSVIDRLVETQQEILVWGAGLHTQRILGCTDFGRANIRAFVDLNPQYEGEMLLGKPIVVPHVVEELPLLPIVISSRRLQGEIKRWIQTSGLKNPLVLLYPEKKES